MGMGGLVTPVLWDGHLGGLPLALPAWSIAYTALGGIRLIDPAGWIGPPSLVDRGPSCTWGLVVDWGSGWHLRARALAPIWVLNRMWYALLGTKLSCAPIALLRNG